MYGWNNGDALHCRTRAIWDPDMLFMSVKKISEQVIASDPKTVYTTIIDYSDKGIITESCLLSWRISGTKKWNQTPLIIDHSENHFYGEIDHHVSGDVIEYFISSISKSGREESRPKTAPGAYYSFSIE